MRTVIGMCYWMMLEQMVLALIKTDTLVQILMELKVMDDPIKVNLTLGD